MAEKIELGTIQWSVEVKDGKLCHGSPRMDILQDNLKEVESLIPDGHYKWELVLDLNQAVKIEGPTIQEIIDHGWINCPKCNIELKVAKNGDIDVTGCKCFEHWNLFLQLGEE